MKRHPALQPISRDHHDLLVLARELRRGAEGDQPARERAVRACGAAWDEWVERALGEQERSVGALIGEPSVRAGHERALASVRATFAELRAAGDGAEAEILHSGYERLQAAVRWIERELFPRLQEELDEQVLRELAEQWRAIEVTRPRSTPQNW